MDRAKPEADKSHHDPPSRPEPEGAALCYDGGTVLLSRATGKFHGDFVSQCPGKIHGYTLAGVLPNHLTHAREVTTCARLAGRGIEDLADVHHFQMVAG